jgi:hypothetical protein
MEDEDGSSNPLNQEVALLHNLKLYEVWHIVSNKKLCTAPMNMPLRINPYCLVVGSNVIKKRK